MGKRSDPAAAAASVARVEKVDAAVELRRQGKSFRAIALELKCSRKNAELLVTEGLRAIPAANVEELRKVDGERLDELWAGLVKAATYDDKGRLLEGGAVEGEPQAIVAAIKVLERRARLFGLDAATKVSLEGKKLSEMSDAELQELRERLSKAVP